MAIDTLESFRAAHARSIARLYQRGRADRWHLGETAVAETVFDSVRSWGESEEQRAVDGYIERLNAEDLVLACACRAGVEAAWEYFIERFRPILYGAARALTRDQVRGRDIADSLFAELYGLEIREQRRRSLLAYFHGRSSLATWLRAVLAQRHIDSIRAEHRTESLEIDPPSAAPSQCDPPDPSRARYLESLNAALGGALAELKPRDRLRLHYYYMEQLTLAEIGRLLGEHESSASRRLKRTRKELRNRVERWLRLSHLSDEQIALCYDYAREEWPFDLSGVLAPSGSR